MKKEEFYFDSKDGSTKIRALRFIPEGEVKAILQISHGMVEFIDRYEGFATYLTEQGFLVTGNDHLGHGGSVKDKSDWGYFGKDGYNTVLNDLLELTHITKELYPNKPYFLLGHSMGSFLARLYTIKYGNELDAAIIMGTGQQTKGMIGAAKFLTNIVKTFKGERYRSRFLNGLALGSYNKKWEPSDTHCNWLTKDDKVVDWYYHEPRCHFIFTTNGFYNLFSLIGEIIDKNNIEKMPKDLPILVISGEDDPVGNFGKDPKALADIYKEVGIKDVELKLYPNDRHEILNEFDKDVVYKDISDWLNKHI